MKPSNLTQIFAVIMAIVALSGCANTIRGFGQDAANAVDATEDAGQNVAGAAN